MTKPLSPNELTETAQALEGTGPIPAGYHAEMDPRYGKVPTGEFSLPVPNNVAKPPQEGLGFTLIYIPNVLGHRIAWIEKPDTTKRIATFEEEKLWKRLLELESQLASSRLDAATGVQPTREQIESILSDSPREPTEPKKSKKKP